jgi:hypothetical protein
VGPGERLARPPRGSRRSGDGGAPRLWSELLRAAGSGGDLTTDAWIAAIALAHGASVLTLDSDFARFRACALGEPTRELSAPWMPPGPNASVTRIAETYQATSVRKLGRRKGDLRDWSRGTRSIAATPRWITPAQRAAAPGQDGGAQARPRRREGGPLPRGAASSREPAQSLSLRGSLRAHVGRSESWLQPSHPGSKSVGAARTPSGIA